MCEFSVILCNYNYAQFLAEAIEGVLRQTFTDFELIVVDDGSTDASRDIISSCRDKRLVAIFQENGGQAAAFNCGFEASRGRYVAFLDSDDVWYPQKLQATHEAFRDGVVAVQHSLDVIDQNSVRLGWTHPKLAPGVWDVLKDYARENHTGFFSATSGVVCRKDVLDKIFPIDAEWRICADVALTRPLPVFGRIATLKGNYGAYRVHQLNNWMNSEQQKNYIENEGKYVAYANHWLQKGGIDTRLAFEKSRPYRISRILNSRFGRVYFFIRKVRHGCNGFLRAKLGRKISI